MWFNWRVTGYYWEVRWYSVLVGIATPFVYVFLASGAVKVLMELRSWAYCGNVKPFPDDVILLLGAFWPVAVLAGGTVYVFIGIINRIF